MTFNFSLIYNFNHFQLNEVFSVSNTVTKYQKL